MASTLIRRKRFQRLLTPNKQEIDILKLYLAVFKILKSKIMWYLHLVDTIFHLIRILRVMKFK
jgi:hypothetical protein